MSRVASMWDCGKVRSHCVSLEWFIILIHCIDIFLAWWVSIFLRLLRCRNRQWNNALSNNPITHSSHQIWPYSLLARSMWYHSIWKRKKIWHNKRRDSLFIRSNRQRHQVCVCTATIRIKLRCCWMLMQQQPQNHDVTEKLNWRAIWARCQICTHLLPAPTQTLTLANWLVGVWCVHSVIEKQEN